MVVARLCSRQPWCSNSWPPGTARRTDWPSGRHVPRGWRIQRGWLGWAARTGASSTVEVHTARRKRPRRLCSRISSCGVPRASGDGFRPGSSRSAPQRARQRHLESGRGPMHCSLAGGQFPLSAPARSMPSRRTGSAQDARSLREPPPLTGAVPRGYSGTKAGRTAGAENGRTGRRWQISRQPEPA